MEMRGCCDCFVEAAFGGMRKREGLIEIESGYSSEIGAIFLYGYELLMFEMDYVNGEVVEVSYSLEVE